MADMRCHCGRYGDCRCGYRRNFARSGPQPLPPEDAAAKIVEFLQKHYDYGEIEVYQQEPYIAAGREHCDYAAFALISDDGNFVAVSLQDKFIRFLGRLGYWAEPYDEAELCVIPIDATLEEQYRDRGLQAKKQVMIDPACQRDFERAKEILEQVPVVGFDEGGMHQYTWIRMRKPVLNPRESDPPTRETIIDMEPHRIDELQEAFEEIRKLKCVSNIWFNLD